MEQILFKKGVPLFTFLLFNGLFTVFSPKIVCPFAMPLDTQSTQSTSYSIVCLRPHLSHDLTWWGYSVD